MRLGRLLHHVLAAVGALVLLAAVTATAFLYPALRDFDSASPDLYRAFATALLETGDPANGMVWSVPVEEGLGIEDVKESLRSLAVEHRFTYTGESDLSRGVQAVTGEACRHIAFLRFCDVRVGKMMSDYNDAYTAFMPCRISVVQRDDGSLWMYALNMDFLIHGGRTLPQPLRSEARRISRLMQDIMAGAAAGEF